MKLTKKNPDAISAKIRNAGRFAQYTPRERAPNEALPMRPDVFSGRYDGKELRPFDARPGAMDAYTLPSRGLN